MTGKIIDDIIKEEKSRIAVDNADTSLASGVLGVAIFMIWYGKESGKNEYVEQGLKLIGDRCLKIKANSPLDLHRGQVGIAICATWLCKAGIIDNEIEDICKNIDDNIFKVVASKNKFLEEHSATLLDIGIYVAIRLRIRSYNELETKLYTRLLSKIINSLYPDFHHIIFKESYPAGYSYMLPRFLFLLALSPGNGFDNRLERIAEEITPMVLSTHPFLSANRLALSNAIYFLNENIRLDNRCENYANLLRDSICITDINTEFSKYQLSMYDGLGWLAIQVMISDKLKNNNSKDFAELIKSKIQESGIFNLDYKLVCRLNLVGLYGILGLVIVQIISEKK